MSYFIFHIGYPRTATTWFQKEFYPKILNFRYIETPLFMSYLNQNQDDSLNEFISSYINNDTNYIICDEEIINSKKDTISIDKKALKISKYFTDSLIIIFIRNQINIIESKYSFYIKSGGTLSIEELINDLFKTNKIKQWNYYEQIKLYTNLFGNENIKVFLYEDFINNQNKFINNFINDFNFDITLNKINFKKINKSLNPLSISFLQFTNKFSKVKIGFNKESEKLFFHIPFSFEISHRFIYFIDKFIPNTSFSLEKNISKATYKKLIQYFSLSNKKLASEYKMYDIQKYNYPL